jgi:hypothetical protein
MLDLKVATPQMILNYALMLQVRGVIEGRGTGEEGGGEGGWMEQFCPGWDMVRSFSKASL